MNDNQNNRGKNIFEILEQLFPTDLMVRFLVLFTLGMAGMFIVGGGIIYLIVIQFACAPSDVNPDPCGAGVDIFSFIVVVAMIFTIWVWFRLTK